MSWRCSTTAPLRPLGKPSRFSLRLPLPLKKGTGAEYQGSGRFERFPLKYLLREEKVPEAWIDASATIVSKGDDDLAFAEGKDDELLGRVQRKLGKTKEDVRREIESL